MTGKLEIASPWLTFARKVYKMFERDVEVRVEWVEDAKEIKLYVASQEKADALSAVMPSSREFGNITVKITIIPANKEANDPWDLFLKAFKGNEAVSFTDRIEAMGFNAGYVIFKPDVVQYPNDNLADFHGIESTLYQDIANEIFEEHAGVFFCTDIEDQTFLGKPLGEWP